MENPNPENWRSVPQPDLLEPLLRSLDQEVFQLAVLALIFVLVGGISFLALRRLFARPTAQIIPFDRDSATPAPKDLVLSGKAHVTDGDTITIQKTQIRLFGIDAPEMDHPHGEEAKWALHKLCKGQTIRAELHAFDKYGRTVARCFLADGRDLSAEMVKQGLAIDWAKFSGGVYRHLERPGVRKKLFLAHARQQGRMYVWRKFERQQRSRSG